MKIADILQNDGIQLSNDIRANMGSVGMNATNETARSLRIEIKQEGTKTTMTLFGRPFFMAVQTGRKPTPDKKPSREMINRITAWVEARNIPLEAVWGIATNIQQKGTKLWREGGRKDIVDPAIEEFINSATLHIADSGAEDLILKLRQMKW
jgi:hypothetical protein